MTDTERDRLVVCPCGSVPTALNVTGEFLSPKSARASGNCCGEWEIEFRNNYTPIDSNEGMALAVKAWNDATRGRK